MLQKLVTYGTYGTLFCGVEHSTKVGVLSLNGLVLKQRKNEFSIDKEFQVDTVSELKNYVETKQHVFVTINTEKVLFKSLDVELDHQKALIRAFPNLKIEDFYFELHVSNNKTYVAICRKDEIESILKEYELHKFNVIGFSLGNLVISQLESLIDEASVQSSNSTIKFRNNAVSEIVLEEVDSRNYSINGLQVRNMSILSLAGILNYYMNAGVRYSNFVERTNQLKHQFKQQRFFHLGLKASLGFIFISLLVSFVLFTHYSSQIENATRSLAVNKSQKNTLLKLADDFSKKEKLLNDFSLVSSKSSWHLDQLGQTIPTSIILTEIQWQPLANKIKETKKIETQEHTILIKGKTYKSSNFSEWIDNLEGKEWIATVSINVYGIHKKSVPKFEIEIRFKP